MTIDEFKLKQYRILYKELASHKKNMQAHRATANKITIGFLDAIEELHERELIHLNIHINMLKPRKDGEKTPYISPNDIALAKTIPISNFIKIPASKKILCLFHNDKNPSLHVYGTSYYCFVCSANGTTIDIIMKLRNCSFTQAVRFLNGK